MAPERFFKGEAEIVGLKNDNLIKSFICGEVTCGERLIIEDFQDLHDDQLSQTNSLLEPVASESTDLFREFPFHGGRETPCDGEQACPNEAVCIPKPDELLCYESYNQSFRHGTQTVGLVADWAEPGYLEIMIAESHRSKAGGKDVLSFRVAQVSETEPNPNERHRNTPGMSRSLTIEVRDTSGKIAGTVVTVPFPYERDRKNPDYAATVLATIRTPIECFAGIDVGAIEAIRFSVDSPALLAFDDIELTD